MAELFRVRAKAGKIKLPPRLAFRLGCERGAVVELPEPKAKDGQEVEILLGDDLKMKIVASKSHPVLGRVTDEEAADYSDRRKAVRSVQDLNGVLTSSRRLSAGAPGA